VKPHPVFSEAVFGTKISSEREREFGISCIYKLTTPYEFDPILEALDSCFDCALALDMYFGVSSGMPLTYKQVGQRLPRYRTQEIGVGVERVRQLVMKGLRMLRHPRRMSFLQKRFKFEPYR
jgi:hypothetical protein